MRLAWIAGLAALFAFHAVPVPAQERTPTSQPDLPDPAIAPMVMPYMGALEQPLAMVPSVVDQASMALEMAEIEAPMLMEQAQIALAGAGVALSRMATPRARVAPEPVARPRAAWVQGDPADSLYKAARAALNRNDFRTSSELFSQIRTRFPRSAYVPDALYWQAFSLRRMGGEDRLRNALDLLERLRRDHPQAKIGAEATTLATIIRGELARRGDAEAAAEVAAIAGAVAPPPANPAVPTTPRAAGPARAPRPPRTPRPGRISASDADELPQGCSAEDYEDKVAALNALLQMNPDRAVPLLKGLLARRDECSAPLRRKAMFLVAQQHSPESVDLLLGAVKNDPDPEVRKQGIFWLGQVEDERAVDILGEILRTSTDVESQKRAMFALSQHRSTRAGQMIKDYAARSDAPVELRKQAIFDVGQQQSAENAAFLRELYGKVTDTDLRERILFSVSQMRGEGTGNWLLEIAANTSEPVEMRKKALFWASQQRETDFSTFAGLYDKMPDHEMKKQLIYVYSQRSEPEAVDRLLEIARSETDRELQKQAMFWLAQSRDPRAMKFYEDILSR